MLVYDMAIWSILLPSGILYVFLLYFKVIWYILPVLVTCSKKNLATLLKRVLAAIGMMLHNHGSPACMHVCTHSLKAAFGAWQNLDLLLGY
jgi:hypothetical protein